MDHPVQSNPGVGQGFRLPCNYSLAEKGWCDRFLSVCHWLSEQSSPLLLLWNGLVAMDALDGCRSRLFRRILPCSKARNKSLHTLRGIRSVVMLCTQWCIFLSQEVREISRFFVAPATRVRNRPPRGISRAKFEFLLINLRH